MKLYTFPMAPSPQRVHVFMKEKGIEIPCEVIDMMKAEQLGDAYRTINPRCTLPALVLEDGTVISEVVAICHYLEKAYPDAPLYGKDAKNAGIITEWEHRAEVELGSAIADALRNKGEAFKGRALPGALDVEQIPELVDRGHKRIAAFFEVLDKQLEDNQFIAGDTFSAADIAVTIFVNFAAWVKATVPESLVNLTGYMQRQANRDCFKP